jgi:hypothetical protein
MFKTRFPLIAAMLFILFVSLAVTSPLSHTSESMDLSWPPRPVLIPLRSLDVYHQSERTLLDPNAGLSIYHQSEWTLTDPSAGLSIYLQSERTFVDPQAGMAIYHHSERTRVPVRFTKYQLSEWFGRS